MSETIDKSKFMTDSRGRLVPIEMVPDVDRLRHQLVLELIGKARRLLEEMADFKSCAALDIEAFVELSAEQYDVKFGGQKGNITLNSFDGLYKIQVAIHEHLAFDERLQVAKKLVDECLNDWAEDSPAELKTIVLDAFQVDQEGRINTGRILALRRYAIDDERWQRAMQAIADGVQVVGSKAYLRFYERKTPDGQWKPIALDLAAI